MADAPIGGGPYGSFHSLITQLANNQLQMSALLKNINTTLTPIANILSAPQYVAGNWTPADNSGATLTFSAVASEYTQVGRLIFAAASLTYPTTANGNAASIAGLPIHAVNAQTARCPASVLTSGATELLIVPNTNTSTASFLNAATGAAVTNANLSTLTLSFMLIYPTS